MNDVNVNWKVATPAQIGRAPEGVDLASSQKLSVEFVDFMGDYSLYASANIWSEGIMIQRLTLYLNGAAREAFSQINRAAINTWIQTKTAISEKLFSGNVGRIIRQKLYLRVQKPGESVGEFDFHLSTLAAKSFGAKAEWGEQTRQIQEEFLSVYRIIYKQL